VPWVAAAAAGLGVWLAVDAYRQVQDGSADAGLWFTVGAAAGALVAAVGVGRRPEQRRMALLMLGWLAVVEGGLARPAFMTSRLAMTIALYATGLLGPTYAQMTLSYPSGRLRERRERVFLLAAYAAGIGWIS